MVEEETDKDGGNPVIGGLLVIPGIEFHHVVDADTVAYPDSQPDHEVEQEDLALRSVVAGFFFGFSLLLGLGLDVFELLFFVDLLRFVEGSQDAAIQIDDDPGDEHGVDSEGNDVGTFSSVISLIVENRVPHAVVNESDEDEGES